MSVLINSFRFGAPSTLLSGLTSYWKLDEASGAAADVLGANNLTANNSPVAGTGKIGNGRALVAASSQYLSNTSPTLAPGTNDFSIGFWVKPSDLGTIRTVLSWGVQGNGNQFLWVYLNSSNGWLSVQINDGSGAHLTITGTTNNTTGTWVHYVLNFDRDGNLTFYRNGSSGASGSIATKAGAVSPSGSLYVGRYVGENFNFDGVLDEVAWRSRLLTADEITELYNAGAGKTHPFT